MRLEVKFGRRAEGCGEHLHEPLPVAPRVQTVHGVLDDVQTLVARRLQVVLGRQVGPEGPVQTGVVSQIAALAGKRGAGSSFKSGCDGFRKKFQPQKPQTAQEKGWLSTKSKVQMAPQVSDHTNKLAGDQTSYFYSPWLLRLQDVRKK